MLLKTNCLFSWLRLNPSLLDWIPSPLDYKNKWCNCQLLSGLINFLHSSGFFNNNATILPSNFFKKWNSTYNGIQDSLPLLSPKRSLSFSCITKKIKCAVLKNGPYVLGPFWRYKTVTKIWKWTVLFNFRISFPLDFISRKGIVYSLPD